MHSMKIWSQDNNCMVTPFSLLNSSNHLENYASEGFIDYSKLEQLLVVSTLTKDLCKYRTTPHNPKDAYEQAILRALETPKISPSF